MEAHLSKTLQLAREADLIDDTSASDWYVYQLERFAELVRADEREACAKVVEDALWFVRAGVAKAIRARGQA